MRTTCHICNGFEGVEGCVCHRSDLDAARREAEEALARYANERVADLFGTTPTLESALARTLRSLLAATEATAPHVCARCHAASDDRSGHRCEPAPCSATTVEGEPGHESCSVCGHRLHFPVATAPSAPPASEVREAVGCLLNALYLYPNYRLDSRGPYGCVFDAIRQLDPATAKRLRDGEDAGQILAALDKGGAL